MAMNHKILIIEDDFDISEMLQTFFSTQGYDVATAQWREDGVSSAEEKKPHLIILDIRLPDIDGYEVAKRIKANPATAEIPIIYLTERRDRADRLRGLELGADDYITKPFDMAELKFRVKNIIGRYQPQVQTNAITSLPEGAQVAEKLAASDGTQNVLAFGLGNMAGFSAAFGAAAADDAIRKTNIIIRNSLRDAGIGEYYLGHLGPNSFVLLFTAADPGTFAERITSKLEMAMEFFTPQGVPVPPGANPKLAFSSRYLPVSEASAGVLSQLATDFSLI